MVKEHSPLELLKRNRQSVARIFRPMVYVAHKIDQRRRGKAVVNDLEDLLVGRIRADRFAGGNRNRWQDRMTGAARVPVLAVAKIALAAVDDRVPERAGRGL